MPIAVKDDIDVAGEVTAFGTSAYGEPAAKDAEIVRRARAAGAVVIGKTNVPELCAVPWTESPTWGATRNPWALERTPGGSSGGTAAAVAAGLVGAGLGSDAGGSIRCPAAYCGLFGLKTQRGRVPLAPQRGCLARPVGERRADALGARQRAVLRRDRRRAARTPGRPSVPPSSLLAAVGAAGERLSRRRGAAGAADRGRQPAAAVAADAPARATTAQRSRRRCELLRRLGHEVNERELDYGPLVPPPEFTVRFLRSRHEDAVALAHPERLERRMRAIARLGGLIGPGIVAWARGREAAYAARLNEPLADHDVLLTPVTPAPPPRIGACEGRGWLSTTLVAAATVPYLLSWNLTGQPACSVPAGFAPDGLPRAVQLVGRPNDEATLLLARRPARGRAPVGAEPPGRLLVSARSEALGEELLEVAVDAARMAGGLLLERARDGGEREVASKSTPTDLVSEADLASERAIRELLAATAPAGRLRGRGGRLRARARAG